MCGIVSTIIPRSAARLAHRGPDGTGAVDARLPWATVSLEMTRLAVVDRTAIAVPFNFTASVGVMLAFNGEIYNWRDLRAELSDGTPWETNCDAEVVARGWRRWGVDVLRRLNGMFGFVLVDEREGVIFAARDRAGEKPLYYAPLGNGLALASEIKALPVAFSEVLCPELETLEFDCLERTPFKDVRCLGPGEYLLFRNPVDILRPHPCRWWDLPEAVDESMLWAAAVEETHALLADAVRIRTVTEVPVALQLSGGLDSALVYALAHRHADITRLYTVTFPDDGIDNTPAASSAAAPHGFFARGGALTLIQFGLADLERVLPKVAYHLDTPATWSAVCQWFMDEAAARDGAVVVLSGEGADELFGGYSRYRILHHLQAMMDDGNLTTYRPLQQAVFGPPNLVMARMLNRHPDMLHYALHLVERFAGEGDLCRRMARVDFYTTMQVLLRMADRMAAAFSLENRSPFFDYRLMELAARMPTRWKVTEGESKAVLRAVARRVGVPAVITDDKNKRGLVVPWTKWRGAVGGARGAWDRADFAAEMRDAWRSAFFTTRVGL